MLVRAALVLTLVLTNLVVPLASEAQQAKVPRIGVFSLDFPNDSVCVDEVRRGLNELGYVEGRTHILELRWAEDRADRLPSLAADRVRTKVDLIASAAGPAATILQGA